MGEGKVLLWLASLELFSLGSKYADETWHGTSWPVEQMDFRYSTLHVTRIWPVTRGRSYGT